MATIDKPQSIKIKIPKGLSLKLAKDRRELKSVSFFLYLKQKYPNGTTEFSCKNCDLWASELQISSRTVRTRIKELQTMKLIYFKGAFIYLQSMAYLSEQFNNQKLKFTYVRSKQSVERTIRAVSIKENLEAQDYELEKKYKSEISPGLSFKEWKEARKGREIFEFVNVKRYKEDIGEQSSPIPCISQRGIASMFWLKSQASGNYWIKKLSEDGLLRAEKPKRYTSKVRNRYSTLGTVHPVIRKNYATVLVMPANIEFLMFEKI